MARIKNWRKTIDNTGKKRRISSVIMAWTNIPSDTSILIKITNRGNYELVDDYGNDFGVSTNLKQTKRMAMRYMRRYPNG